MNMDLATARGILHGYSQNGRMFFCQPDTGDGYLHVVIEGLEEFPVAVAAGAERITCTAHLWHEDEIPEALRPDLDAWMLSMNPQMGLSSFGHKGDGYVMFRSLDRRLRAEDFVNTVETVCQDAIRADAAARTHLRTLHKDGEPDASAEP